MNKKTLIINFSNLENTKKIILKINEKKFEENILIYFEIDLNYVNKNLFKEDYKKIIEDKNEISKLFKSQKNIFFSLCYKIKDTNNSQITFINNSKKIFDLVFGLGGLNKYNRFFCENTKIDFLIMPHNNFFQKKYDFLNHFNSGLNQVLSKELKKNEIGIINFLNFFYENDDFHISKEIGRINQNLKFSQKFKFSFTNNFLIKDEKDLKRLDLEKLKIVNKIFDFNTKNLKENEYLIDKKIQQNLFKKSDNFITKGIKKITN